jgi:hypothetical protein
MPSSTGLHIGFFVMRNLNYIELLLCQLQMKILFLNTQLDQEITYVPIVVLYGGKSNVLEELYVARMGRMEI